MSYSKHHVLRLAIRFGGGSPPEQPKRDYFLERLLCFASDFFHALAPYISGDVSLDRRLLTFLMRAASFVFTPSLLVAVDIDDALITNALSRLDFVRRIRVCYSKGVVRGNFVADALLPSPRLQATLEDIWFSAETCDCDPTVLIPIVLNRDDPFRGAAAATAEADADAHHPQQQPRSFAFSRRCQQMAVMTFRDFFDHISWNYSSSNNSAGGGGGGAAVTTAGLFDMEALCAPGATCVGGISNTSCVGNRLLAAICLFLDDVQRDTRASSRELLWSCEKLVIGVFISLWRRFPELRRSAPWTRRCLSICEDSIGNTENNEVRAAAMILIHWMVAHPTAPNQHGSHVTSMLADESDVVRGVLHELHSLALRGRAQWRMSNSSNAGGNVTTYNYDAPVLETARRIAALLKLLIAVVGLLRHERRAAFSQLLSYTTRRSSDSVGAVAASTSSAATTASTTNPTTTTTITTIFVDLLHGFLAPFSAAVRASPTVAAASTLLTEVCSVAEYACFLLGHLLLAAGPTRKAVLLERAVDGGGEGSSSSPLSSETVAHDSALHADLVVVSRAAAQVALSFLGEHDQQLDKQLCELMGFLARSAFSLLEDEAAAVVGTRHEGAAAKLFSDLFVVELGEPEQRWDPRLPQLAASILRYQGGVLISRQCTNDTYTSPRYSIFRFLHHAMPICVDDSGRRLTCERRRDRDGGDVGAAPSAAAVDVVSPEQLQLERFLWGLLGDGSAVQSVVWNTLVQMETFPAATEASLHAKAMLHWGETALPVLAASQ